MPENMKGAYLGTIPAGRGLKDNSLFATNLTNDGVNYPWHDYDERMRSGEFWNGRNVDSYVLDTLLHDEFTTLYKTQQLAAREMGFENDTVGATGRQTWRQYLDWDNNFDYPTSATELQEQLAEIETWDKTEAQQAFLGQTQYTKYLMYYIDTIGGTDKVYKMLTTDAPTPWLAWEHRTEWQLDEQDPSPRGVLNPDLQSYIQPWMMPGEKVLPDFMMEHLSDKQKRNVDAMSTKMWSYWNANVGNQFPAVPQTQPKPVGWDVKFGDKEDEDEEDEDKDEDKPEKKEDKRIEPEFIRLGGMKVKNPKYIPPEDDVLPSEEPTTVSHRPDLEVKSEWEQSIILAGDFSGVPSDYYQSEYNDGSRPDNWRDIDRQWLIDHPPEVPEPDPVSKILEPAPTPVIAEDDDLEGLPSGYRYEDPAYPYNIIGPDGFYGSISEVWKNVDEHIRSDRETRKEERQARKDQKHAEKLKERAAEIAAEVPQPSPEPTVEQHLTELQEYTQDEHGIIPGVEVTPENYPWLAFTADGKPALYEDPALEEKLGLPDHVKAIQQQNGVVHTAWMPNMIKPAFAGTLDTGHSQEVLVN